MTPEEKEFRQRLIKAYRKKFRMPDFVSNRSVFNTCNNTVTGAFIELGLRVSDVWGAFKNRFKRRRSK